MENNQKKSSLSIMFSRWRHPDRGRLLTIWIMKTLAALWGKKPLSLSTLLFLLKRIPKSKNVDGLFVYDNFKERLGIELVNTKLAGILAKQPLGKWSLDVEAINYVEEDVKKIRPQRILEFGSGISTLCLAQFLTEIHGKEPEVRIYSVEQDENFAMETEKLIRDQGFGQFVRILHVPLIKGVVEGVDYYSYDLGSIGEITNGIKFDYCLIDGPSGKALNARFATLPLIKKHLNNRARFVLDDALRTRELLVAEKWQRLPYLKIQGVVLLAKGVLIGFING
jgi:hypothetical protein